MEHRGQFQRPEGAGDVHHRRAGDRQLVRRGRLHQVCRDRQNPLRELRQPQSSAGVGDDGARGGYPPPPGLAAVLPVWTWTCVWSMPSVSATTCARAVAPPWPNSCPSSSRWFRTGWPDVTPRGAEGGALLPQPARPRVARLLDERREADASQPAIGLGCASPVLHARSSRSCPPLCATGGIVTPVVEGAAWRSQWSCSGWITFWIRNSTGSCPVPGCSRSTRISQTKLDSGPP